MEKRIRKISLLVSRLIAFLMDFVLILIVMAFLSSKLIQEYEDKIWIIPLIFLLLFETYFFLLELLFNCTFGKLIFGLRVRATQIKQNQSKSHYLFTRVLNLFVRNCSRVLIFIPPLFIWNEILILIFYKGKSFSEMISKLQVDFKNQESFC